MLKTCVLTTLLLATPALSWSETAKQVKTSSPEGIIAKEQHRGDASDEYSQIMLQIGLRYYLGEGMPQDYTQAATWIEKAADAGNSDAMYALGSMYANGEGIPQDYKQAATWFKKAAKAGNSDAMNNLGVMYSEGKGVPQDYTLAYMWINLAAEGNSNAAENRDKLIKLMSPTQIEEGQRLTREWLERKDT